MSSTRNYSGKVSEWMAQIESERIQALRGMLREAGESGDTRFDANTVYNMSPEALRSAANELIDSEKVIDDLLAVPGVDAEQVAEDTADMSPSEIWDYAQDTSLKAEIALRISTSPEPGSVSVENLLRWMEAEDHLVDREIIQEQYPDTDFSRMHDDDLRDFLVEQSTKALLGKDDSPLDSETIIDHKRAELISDLTNNYGFDRDEINSDSLGDLMQKHADAEGSVANDTSNDQMNPNQKDADIPQTVSPDPRTSRLNEQIQEGGHPSSGSDDDGGQMGTPGQGGASSGGSGTTSGVGTGAINESMNNGSNIVVGGSGEESTSNDAGGAAAPGQQADDEPAGPPPGSTHYGYPITDMNNEVIGGETGYRDKDGNWYESDGTAMHPHKAERMEQRYQDGDLNKGSTVPEDTGSDDAAGGDAAPDDQGGNGGEEDTDGVEYTPSGDGMPSGPSPSTDEAQAAAEQYRVIIETARGNSTVNPVRVDGEPIPEGGWKTENLLTGPDGDNRLDGAAGTGTAEIGPVGPDFSSSQGAGTIDYGPDANVDYGDGPQDEVPTGVGRTPDMSHLEDQIMGESGTVDSPTGPLPEGVSPSDLNVGTVDVPQVDGITSLPPQMVEPVFHMAIDDSPATTTSGNSNTAEDEESLPEIVKVEAVVSLDVFDHQDEAPTGDEEESSPPGTLPEVPQGETYTIPEQPAGTIVEQVVLEPVDDTNEPSSKVEYQAVTEKADVVGTPGDGEPPLTFHAEPVVERQAEAEPEPVSSDEDETSAATQFPVELIEPAESLVVHSEIIESRVSTQLVVTDDDEDDDVDG